MTNSYERKESYKPEELLNFLPDTSLIGTKEIRKIKKDYNGDLIKLGSDRYFTFSKSLHCAFCNIKGSVFYKERIINRHGTPCSETFHFNLYAIDNNGQEVLMTKDHIVPVAKNGENSIHNYQTACTRCNLKKAHTDNDVFIKNNS